MAKKKKHGSKDYKQIGQASNELEVQNAAKTLFANIRFASPDDPLRVIALTSSVPNEGKTVTSIELARAIASSGALTLLVEGDMRRRSCASALGVHSSAGVYAVLSDQVALDRAVVGTSTPNLYFLDVEPNIPNPADILSSRRYAHFVDVAADSFDYVIFDTPPVGTFVDAAILSTLVDGVVMVVRPGATKRDQLVHAVEQLRKADANIIGACATFCEDSGSEYYYAYYTKSGERVKDKPAASTSDAAPSTPSRSSARATTHAAASYERNSAPVSVGAASASTSNPREIRARQQAAQQNRR